MRDGEVTFRRAEEIIGVLGRQRHHQRVRIGHTDILAGKAHEAAQQIERRFPRRQHAFEIIQRRIGVRPAQRLVQRRDQPIMPLAVLVINRHAPVQQRRQPGGVERFGQLHRKKLLDLVEQEAPVTIRRSDERGARLAGQRQRPTLAGFGAIKQFGERRFVEPPHDQHLRAAEDGGVQFEAGVFGGRADERHRAVLDDAQETILLGAIEAMDFIDEQQGLLTRPGCVPRFGKQLFQFGNARKHRRNADETQAHCFGEQPRDAGLAGARRAPQDEAAQRSRRHHAADGAFRPGQMALSHDLGERAWPQPFRQRRIGGRSRRCIAEQISHRRRLPL